jgi:hypothetical protein
MASWLGRPSVDRVVVDLPWVEEDDRQRVAKALRRYFNDCGCFWGTPVFLVALLSGLILLDGADTWQGVVGCIVFALVAGAAGKLLGLAWSRWRLLAWLRRLALEAPTEPLPVTRRAW